MKLADVLPDRVSAVRIVNKRILLVSDGTGVYWTPGGKVEQGETREQALVRELEEEIQGKSPNMAGSPNPKTH